VCTLADDENASFSADVSFSSPPPLAMPLPLTISPDHCMLLQDWPCLQLCQGAPLLTDVFFFLSQLLLAPLPLSVGLDFICS